MIFRVGDVMVSLIDEDDRNVIHQKKNGYEKESLEVWAKLVKPGAIALDIGAYTGLYTIIAAKLGAEAIALEPLPANAWRLGINCAANKVKGVAVQWAASDRDGTAVLHYNPHVPLTTGASLETGIRMHSDSIEVRCVKIDSLGFSYVAAIKIDVERHEPCVIRGAMQTIERDRPALLIETLDGDMRSAVEKILPAYEVAAILDGRNTLFTPK